ncbi:conjugal transfer protein TraG [Brevundimonas sp. 357]|nr:type IV secretory system conjugative DNA transfer family protein [uncultured Brevundimonas sp.]RSB43091.1 conjugal transfer protein TraG [Brevundimonas sp. 357]
MKPYKPKRVKTSKAALWGLGLLLVYAVIASWATTQWLAHRFAYQSELGERGVLGLYGPFDGAKWVLQFYRSAPDIFLQGLVGWAVALTVGLLAYVMLVGFGQRSPKQHDGIHGTAHWATQEEVQESGLLPPDGEAGKGVYCGAYTDKKGRIHYLRHDGPEHVAAIAPTRSGKGVGLVVPTLLSWPHSVVINDMKGELWAMTSGWRQKHANNVVLKFDPAAAEGSAAFNPLNEIRLGTIHETGDVQNLVTIIVDPDGKGMENHWSKTAHAFLTGVILHLQYLSRRHGGETCLADVAHALSDPNRDVKKLYEAMLNNQHRGPGQPHEVVQSAARDMLNRAENERSGVLSTAMSYLSLYRDPLVANNTSRSDFRISDLMDHDRPVSLYLVIRPEAQDRMRPLVRLILNQIVRVLLRPELKYVEGRQQSPHKHRLLLMLDEFPSYGRLDVFQEALAYIAGYGIKAYLIMQDISQLYGAYGQHESIIANCHLRIAYAPNRQETGRWLSDNCGVETVIKENQSVSGARFGAFLQSVSRSFQETQRPLLTPDEAMRLKSPKKDKRDQIVSAGEVVVLQAGHAPILGTQSLYFLDPVFRERVKIPPPTNTDSVEARPPEPPQGPDPAMRALPAPNPDEVFSLL